MKGYLSVTSYGGNSPNSEYEYLTGNSVGWFPYGTNAFRGLVNDKQEAMPGILKSLGYHTVGLACSGPGLYDVGKVYRDLFKFDESYFWKQFFSRPRYHNGYVLDRVAYDGMLDLFKKRTQENPGQPMFMFLTTYQNHGPYREVARTTVRVKGYEDIYQLNTYLHGLKLSDQTLKELIEYFETLEDDVVLVLYGDHNPSIPEYTEKALGDERDALPLEKRVLLHTTPYLIWANFPIGHEIENMSLSYLSSKVMKIAGLPKTAYQNFLNDTKQYIPWLIHLHT